jgi:hypothetical protein
MKMETSWNRNDRRVKPVLEVLEDEGPEEVTEDRWGMRERGLEGMFDKNA